MSSDLVEAPQGLPWALDQTRSALLIIDMENDFVSPGGAMEVPAARETALPNILDLRKVARSFEIPVIYTTHVLHDDFNVSPLESAYNTKLLSEGMRHGTDGVEIYPELAPDPNEPVIRKHRYDAFYNTALETIIRNIGGMGAIDTVIITGTVTNVCCESTARSAFMRDFKVAFVSDACGGLDDASHEATCRNIGMFFGRVMTTQQAIDELRGARAD